MRLTSCAALLFPLLTASAAFAEEREFCPERPGLGTPACVLDKGKLQAELGIADWTLDRQPDERTDDIVAGDLLLRYGIGPSTELRVGWTAFGHERVRDRTTGAVSHGSGIGDVTLGVKQALLDPDGDKLTIALLPSVTLPVGDDPAGAGDWGASLLVPVSYKLSDKVELDLTPEVDAAVDEDRDGRHLAYSLTAGLAFKLSDAWSVTPELQALRDDDPEGHETQTRAALSAAYQFGKDWQLDLGGVAGLDHQAPDVELAFGVAHRF